jgi:hypothetical protein
MKFKSRLLMMMSAVALNLAVLSEGHAIVSEIHWAPLDGVTESVSSGIKTTVSSFADGISGVGSLLETHVDLGFLTSGTSITATVSPFNFGGFSNSIFYMRLSEQQGDDWLTQAISVPAAMGKSFAALTLDLASSSYYRLEILGLSTGMHGGLLNGSVTTVVAVPEPEEWAMMMVGVGLIGYQIRRKQRALNRQFMLA